MLIKTASHVLEDHSSGEENNYLGKRAGGQEYVRRAIEPIDQPDREFEEKLAAFFDFERNLEHYYWHCR